jgi:hypothetical protein
MKKQLQKTPTQIALTIMLVYGLIITGRFINNNCKVMNIEIQANQETAPSFFNLFY